MKTICYRGGIAIFALPDHWTEEYDPDGGGTFFDPYPGSGTLRLNVISFSAPRPQARNALLQKALPDASGTTKGGLPLRRRTVSEVEEGQPLEIHRWEIAIPVPPASLRIACFTYTMLAGQLADASIAAELRQVEESITNAVFSEEPGVVGPYHHGAA